MQSLTDGSPASFGGSFLHVIRSVLPSSFYEEFAKYGIPLAIALTLICVLSIAYLNVSLSAATEDATSVIGQRLDASRNCFRDMTHLAKDHEALLQRQLVAMTLGSGSSRPSDTHGASSTYHGVWATEDEEAGRQLGAALREFDKVELALTRPAAATRPRATSPTTAAAIKSDTSSVVATRRRK